MNQEFPKPRHLPEKQPGVPHMQEFTRLQKSLIEIWGTEEAVRERYGLDNSDTHENHNRIALAWIESGMTVKFAEFQRANPDLDFDTLDDEKMNEILAELMVGE